VQDEYNLIAYSVDHRKTRRANTGFGYRSNLPWSFRVKAKRCFGESIFFFDGDKLVCRQGNSQAASVAFLRGKRHERSAMQLARVARCPNCEHRDGAVQRCTCALRSAYCSKLTRRALVTKRVRGSSSFREKRLEKLKKRHDYFFFLFRDFSQNLLSANASQERLGTLGLFLIRLFTVASKEQ